MEFDQIFKFAYENVWIIPLLPLIAFLVIVLDRFCARIFLKDIFSKKESLSILVILATFIGLIHSSVLLIGSLLRENFFYEENFKWLTAGNFTLSFGWMVDNLSIMMLMVVTFVSLLIQVYTHGYMEKDPGYRKFYSFLALFNFSMLGLVLSTNLFQIYIFWELVGLCSYFLIGFWLDRPSAAKAAKKAFIVNRIGDSLFLLGILGFLYFTMSYWASNGFTFLSFQPELLDGAVKVALTGAGPVLFTVIAILIFFGAVAKSAQFPLHTWLPDAMEGPTPISALIHAATMVAAGVFLVARIYPILVVSDFAMNFVAWIGAITLFIAATIAITQTDIKRVLAYSTCSQLGYMIMAMGIGAYSAGLFHLCTHAVFKAMLFLCSGAVIYGLHHQQDMKYMGGLRKYMPITAITYLIGTISISGILFSGFWSKDMILGKAFENIMHSGELDVNALSLFTLAFITACMTAFYMFRSYFMTFEGEYRGLTTPHEAPKVMTYPLIILAIPAILMGFVLSGLFGMPSFTEYIHFGHPVHHVDWIMMLLSLIVAVFGVYLAAIFYWDKFKSLDPNNVVRSCNSLYKLSFDKWYFDKAYYWVIDKVFIMASYLCAVFDKFIIDGIVNLVGNTFKVCGHILKLIQNGKAQFAALFFCTGFIIISIVVVLYAMI